jgi:DNA-binding PadR family transcriptional regulator
MARRREPGLLLGEWACLAVLAQGRAHGFAVARHLSATGDVGRAYSISRPLTYRALDTLVERGLAKAVGSEPGQAGGDRTILGITPAGRAQLKRWLREPVAHLRDMRTAFLLKIVATEMLGLDGAPLIDAQLDVIRPLATALAAKAADDKTDPVAAWRAESSRSAVRYVEGLRRSRA